MSRPRIGVTGPDRGGLTAWIFTALAVLRAGGWPLRITPGQPADLERLDGLIIGGGVDLDPSLYGEKLDDALDQLKRETSGPTGGWGTLLFLPLVYILRRLFSSSRALIKDEGRDRLEVALVKTALQNHLPLLGICRGCQLINAALGGTLHREIKNFYVETPYIKSVFPKKPIEVVSDTLLASIFQIERCRVNALNHQAVKETAPDLRICAREPNGLIQAIEHKVRPFVLGVQWHPEYLPHLGRQQNIFHKLVRESRRRSGGVTGEE